MLAITGESRNNIRIHAAGSEIIKPTYPISCSFAALLVHYTISVGSPRWLNYRGAASIFSFHYTALHGTEDEELTDLLVGGLIIS